MKLRNKIIIINLLIIVSILLAVFNIILNTVDNFNIYTVNQYLINQSNFSQSYLTEYFKSKENPAAILENEKASLEDMLKYQVGCEVSLTGLEVRDPSPLQKSALEGKKAYLITQSEGNRSFLLSFPVFSHGEIIGSVLYTYSLFQADEMRRSLLIVLLSLFVAALLGSALLSFLFSYRIIKPLEKLTRMAKDYSQGNFHPIEDIKTGDEVEKLAISFNEMGRSIKEIITELKMEQEKQKKFLDNVTHEIRTPLTNILGYADLTQKIDNLAQNKKYLDYISAEGERLLNMVNSLLELSRLNRYDLAVEKKNSELNIILEQACSLMRDRAEKFGIKVIYELAPVKAMVDGEKIKQVIINLLDNAIKYSEGDLITVRLRKEEMVHICVSDNGKGIPQFYVNSLTEPFYRVDKSRSRKLGGSGLGLSICREIIELHGGQININSEEGKGTTVTILLQP
jgi:signal transduction histidine kinase